MTGTRMRIAGLLAILLCGIAGGAALASSAPPPVVDRFPGIAPAYALSIDGRLTWGGNLDTPRPPASLVKVLTALTLLADGWQPDAEVPVSRRAADIEGSQVGLRAGERLRAADLLTAMLVRSGNDACVALVEKAAGSLEAFLPRLNARAKELGLTASRFEHPCGLDADGTRTTARDLLRLAEAGMKEPQIALRGHAVEGRIVTLGGREIRFRNSNALIGRDPDAVGLKSGYHAARGPLPHGRRRARRASRHPRHARCRRAMVGRFEPARDGARAGRRRAVTGFAPLALLLAGVVVAVWAPSLVITVPVRRLERHRPRPARGLRCRLVAVDARAAAVAEARLRPRPRAGRSAGRLPRVQRARPCGERRAGVRAVPPARAAHARGRSGRRHAHRRVSRRSSSRCIRCRPRRSPTHPAARRHWPRASRC